MGKLKKGRSKANNKKSAAKMELLKKQQHELAKHRQSSHLHPQSRAPLQTPHHQQGHKQNMTFEDYRQIFAYNPGNDSDDDDDDDEGEYDYVGEESFSQQSAGDSSRGSTGPFTAPASPPPWQRVMAPPVPSVRRSYEAAAPIVKSNAFAIVHPIPAPRSSLPIAKATAAVATAYSLLGNGGNNNDKNGKSFQSTAARLPDSYIPTRNLAEAAAAASATTTVVTAIDGVNALRRPPPPPPAVQIKPPAAEFQSQYHSHTHSSAQSIVASAVTAATANAVSSSSSSATVDGGHLSATSIISLSSGRSEGSLGRAPPSHSFAMAAAATTAAAAARGPKERPRTDDDDDVDVNDPPEKEVDAEEKKKRKQILASTRPSQMPSTKPSVRFSLTTDTVISSASSLSLIDVSAHNITDRSSNSHCSNRVSRPFLGLSSTMRKKRPMEFDDDCSEEERNEILQQPAQKKIICQQQRRRERMEEEKGDDDDDDVVEDMIVEENQEQSMHLPSNTIAPLVPLSATLATVGVPAPAPAPPLPAAAAAAAAAPPSSPHSTHAVINTNNNNAPANGQKKNDRRRRPPWRLRITNVWEGFELENVKLELHRMGVMFQNLRQLHHVKTKQPIGIFEAAIEDSDRGSCYRLLNDGRLLGPTSRIALLPPLPEPTRCFNCQRFGHFASICRGQVICLKCAGGHETRACTKPMEVSPKCSNCDGGHVASYKGCPAYKTARRLVLAKFFANKNKRSGPRVEGVRDGRHQQRKQHRQGPPPTLTPAHPHDGGSNNSGHIRRRRLEGEPPGHRQRRRQQQQPKPQPPQSLHNHNHRHNPQHHQHKQHFQQGHHQQKQQQQQQQQRRMHLQKQQQHGLHGHTGQPKGHFSQVDRVGGGQQQQRVQQSQQQKQQQRHTFVTSHSAQRQPQNSHRSIWDAQDRGQEVGRHGRHGLRSQPNNNKPPPPQQQQQNQQQQQQSNGKQMLSELEMISETRDALKCIINEFTAELSDPKKGIPDKEKAFQAMTQLFSALF